MKRWLLQGDYGTFEISKIVEAEDEGAAHEQTGIMTDLIALGWGIDYWPDGESWEITEVPG